MKICQECGDLVTFDSYFGAYICDECGWMDNSYDLERIERRSMLSEGSINIIEQSDRCGLLLEIKKTEKL